MAVSLRSKAKEASTQDVEIGFARLRAGEDDQGVYWVLPGQQTRVRLRKEALKYARRINDLITSNLGKVRSPADFW